MVELALAAPLFLMILLGIIILGVGVYYQQQVTNVAREAARYAVIHSATAQCPTVSNRDPDPPPQSYYRCDPPELRWPQMTAYARSKIFGLPANAVQISACWSGYWTTDIDGNYSDYDALPADQATLIPNDFRSCTINVVEQGTGATVAMDPRTGRGAGGTTISPACTNPLPLTDLSGDMASDMSASYAGTANQVTVFACYDWEPPMAGFLLIPQSITLTATITETLEYQQ
jgi:hypothetical protein